jgi:hypothetical protein
MDLLEKTKPKNDAVDCVSELFGLLEPSLDQRVTPTPLSLSTVEQVFMRVEELARTRLSMITRCCIAVALSTLVDFCRWKTIAVRATY